jgi:hypothetical protein
LRVAAVKALQQRWQVDAQSISLDRKHEQKLWDAFRQPLDEAFSRKTTSRAPAAEALSDHDRRVVEAAQAVQAACDAGDAAAIAKAVAALHAGMDVVKHLPGNVLALGDVGVGSTSCAALLPHSATSMNPISTSPTTSTFSTTAS